MSVRALAALVGVNQSHLSRVLRRADYQTPSGELAERVAVALKLPHDYFPEYRAAFVVDLVRSDASVRERLYRQLTRQAQRP
jgi:transcriptional regulator with XRE-family HTH domain